MRFLKAVAVYAVIVGLMWLVEIAPEWILSLLSILFFIGVFVGIAKFLKAVIK